MTGDPGKNSNVATPAMEPRQALASPVVETDVHELLAVLNGTHEKLRRLLELAGEKLTAMRGADTAALHECAAEEGHVLRLLFEQEQRRKAILARLAQSMQWEITDESRLSEVAEKLPEPFSSQIRAKTAGLQQTAGELRNRNRVAAAVAHNLHKHIRAVFDDVARVNQETVVYGPSGKHEQRTKDTWVDAVG